MSSSKKTDHRAKADAELRQHVPLLIRWGVATLMMIAALAVLAAQGEGEIHAVSLAVFVIVWLACLWKSSQSAFTVVTALIDRQRDSEPD